jgi:uncharacterized membrane protein (UPF0127 family)
MSKTGPSAMKIWKRRGKLTAYAILAAGIGFLIGMYIIAPLQAKSESYVPNKIEKMTTATVEFKNPTEKRVLIPVNIADTDSEREKGLNGVGTEALHNTFLLYDLNDVQSWGESYDVRNIKAPLSFAVMNGEGKVTIVKNAKVEEEEVEVEKDHRWVLAMDQTVMEEYGIQVGSKLITETLPGNE